MEKGWRKYSGRKYASEKGGDFADVYIENRVSRQIVMEESKFKSGYTVSVRVPASG
jgi:predicted Zn-dependent protease